MGNRLKDGGVHNAQDVGRGIGQGQPMPFTTAMVKKAKKWPTTMKSRQIRGPLKGRFFVSVSPLEHHLGGGDKCRFQSGQQDASVSQEAANVFSFGSVLSILSAGAT